MIKKVTLILLISVYAVAVMGISLRQFYCCGKLQSTNLSLAINTNQSSAEGRSHGCCNNKYSFFKVNDTHVSAEKVCDAARNFNFVHLGTHTFSNLVIHRHQFSPANNIHPPPLYPGVPLFIRNCIYRI